MNEKSRAGRTGGSETLYDRILNEGGEGYNPHRQARLRQEWAAARSISNTPAAELDRLRRDLLVLQSQAYAPAYAEKIKEMQVRIEALEAQIQDEFLARWPRDLTIARREEWNAKVRAGKVRTPADLAREQENQGWSLDELKRAIKAHKL